MFQKSKIFSILVVIFLCFLSSCKSKSLEIRVSEKFGIDLLNSTTISKESDYGSFGDGFTLLIMDCFGTDVGQQISNNTNWKQFPLSHEVEILVYQTFDKFYNSIPEIRNGYYILIDRQDWTDKNILDRYSYNFDIGLYDLEKDVFYYCSLDT